MYLFSFVALVFWLEFVFSFRPLLDDDFSFKCGTGKIYRMFFTQETGNMNS